MRCLTELVLLFIIISIAFVQGKVVVPQINDLNGVISLAQVEQLLSPDKLQQLQNQIFATVITGFRNHWNTATVGQALQQLVTQYVPQLTQMLIDWEAVGQSTLNDVVITLPGILSGALGGLFGKRDLDTNKLQFLAQLPADDLAQIIQAAHIADRTTALTRLRQLLQQFAPASQGRADFDDVAEDLLAHLNSLLPHLNQPNSIRS